MFQIIEIRAGEANPYGEPLRNKHGNLRLLKTGKAAARLAAKLSAATGKKYQPRLIPDAPTWHAREEARFADGSYERIEWNWFNHDTGKYGLTPIDGHFAHHSKKTPGLVAFTSNAAQGLADIRATMRPGRYLSTFYSHKLPSATIARLAAEFSLKYEVNKLLLATTAQDIVHVYRHGPASCMSKSSLDYSSHPHHPCKAYAHSNLACAYMQREGQITARTMVNTESKTWVRIYGDSVRMTPLLVKEGYRGGYLVGGRLAKIPCYEENYFVMPFLDGMDWIVDRGDHWEIVMNDDRTPKSFCASTTRGTIEYDPIEVECVACHLTFMRRGMYALPGEQFACQPCYRTMPACRCCGARALRNNLLQVSCYRNYYRPVTWCLTCTERYARLHNGVWYSGDSFVRNADGTEVLRPDPRLQQQRAYGLPGNSQYVTSDNPFGRR